LLNEPNDSEKDLFIVGPWTVWFPLKCIMWRKMLECFHQKP